MLQGVLGMIQGAFTPMLGRIRPTLMPLAYFLLWLEAVRLAIRWVNGDGDIKLEAFYYALKSAVVLFLLLGGFGAVFEALYQTVVVLGLRAGGDVMSKVQFLDPGAYLHLGFDAAAPLWDKIRLSAILSSDQSALGYLIAWLFCVGGYVLMAFTVFMVQVELSVGLIGAVVIFPFLLWAPTHWIAQGAISYPVNTLFRFFIIAILASALFPIIKNELTLQPAASRTLWQILTTFNEPADKLQEAWPMIIVTLAMGLTYLKASQIASSILSGRPALTGGMAVSGAIAAGVVGTTIIGGAMVGAVMVAGNAGGGLVGLAPAASPVPGSRQPASFSMGGPVHAAARASGAAHAGRALTQGLIHGARFLSHE